MPQQPFLLPNATAFRIRKKPARWLAHLGVFTMLAPVLLTMIAVPLKHAVFFGDALLAAGAISWVAGWILTPVLWLFSYLSSMRLNQRIEHIEVEDGKLRLVGASKTKTIEKEQVLGALTVEEGDDTTEVEVELQSGDAICIRSASIPTLLRLPEALGFSAHAKRTALALNGARTPVYTGCGGAVLGALVTVGATCASVAVVNQVRMLDTFFPYFVGLVFVLATSLFTKVLTARRLVIGADGILVEGAFRNKFYHRSSIFSVERVRQQLALLIRDGAKIRQVNLTSEPGARQVALRRRIEEALKSTGEGGSEPRALLLSRGSETLEKWRERLRKVVLPEKGYRGEVIPMDTLLHAAADMDAPVETRVGAAMAIGLSADDQAKQKLRDTLESIANPRLRIAIENAALNEADEAGLFSAIEEEETLRQKAMSE